MEQRIYRIRKPRYEKFCAIAETSRVHAQEEQMKRGVELFLALLLVLIL
jgi:hypothetical protein